VIQKLLSGRIIAFSFYYFYAPRHSRYILSQTPVKTFGTPIIFKLSLKKSGLVKFDV
jgi:hypothetical protein